VQVGQRVGPFDIEKQLGAGAMGSVYRAIYRKTGQRVAIKVMLAGLGGNETALARFHREASVLKQLHHPNIVRFIASGDFDGAPFYAMEFIQGESLDHMLSRGDRLGWEKVVEIGKQVCAALKHAHDKGIVHRDLKPSNLMVLRDGVVKLTDFGIAKDLDVTQLTSANCTVGTAAYMSPEQCKGERNLTYKSDLYSLGVVLYELLVGHKPFQAETPMDMFLQHVQGTFERPARIVLDIPIWLDNLVCQLLEKKPEHRPYDAGLVADSLDKVAEKFLQQKSAGVEAASARVGDRKTRDQSLDETDREVARTLRTSVHRKRRKRRGLQFYRKGWFVILAILILLGALSAVFYKVFGNPTAAELYRQIEQVQKTGDFDTLREAWADGCIAKYLKLYGGQDDEQSRRVRALSDSIGVRTLESTRLKRRNIPPQDKGEEILRAALEHEEAGDMPQARKAWERLEGLEDLESDDKTVKYYPIYAKQRIGVVDQATELERELTDLAKQMAEADTKIAARDEREQVATDAIRYERFEDLEMAQQRWNELKRTTEKPQHLRHWAIIAFKRLHALKKDNREELDRGELVKKKLAAAEAMVEKQPKDGRAALKEIIYLYKEDKTEGVADLVEKAKTSLKAHTPEGE
jgi:serine/threonine-protein kinase